MKSQSLSQTIWPIFKIIKIVSMAAILISACFAINQFNLSDYFPIKTVRVYGLTRVSPQEIKNTLLPLLDRGFFVINVEYIKDRLLQIPWTGDIFVRRVWPDKIEITVVEKSPAAKWNGQSLLSTGGELFTPKKNTIPADLPELIGPDGKQVFMLQYLKDMKSLLVPLNAKIARLELTPYLSWKLILDNGMTLQMGHKDVLTRLSQFVKVYPKIIKGSASDVEYVDLRYPNGIAVQWKSSIKI